MRHVTHALFDGLDHRQTARDAAAVMAITAFVAVGSATSNCESSTTQLSDHETQDENLRTPVVGAAVEVEEDHADGIISRAGHAPRNLPPIAGNTPLPLLHRRRG